MCVHYYYVVTKVIFISKSLANDNSGFASGAGVGGGGVVQTLSCTRYTYIRRH